MNKTKIIIPSFRRSGIIQTHRVVDECIVCIPESDFTDYVNAGVPRKLLVCHPDDVKGLCPKRNWIFENLQDGDPILSLDDDITTMMCLYMEEGESSNMNPKKIREVIENAVGMAEDLGAHLFGFAATPDRRVYRPHQPFRLTGFVNGWSMGFLPGHKFRFPEDLIGKEDYHVSLQAAYHDRICFIDTRYGFAAHGTFTTPGGLAVYRNAETEKRAVERLQRDFGTDVVKVVTSAGVKAQQHVGYGKVRIELPY